MSQSQPSPSSQGAEPEQQAVLTDAANLPFSQVVKFAQAFGISLEDLSQSLGRSEQSLAASVIRSENPSDTPRASNETDERVNAENARNSEQLDQQEEQHQAQQRQAQQQQRDAQAAQQKLQAEQQPQPDQTQQKAEHITPVNDQKLEELQRRLEKLEASIGSDQANRLGDPSGQPKAQQFRELPVKDALELVFQRIGAEMLEPVLPLEKSASLIDQIHQLRDALARVENELQSPNEQQNAQAAPSQQNSTAQATTPQPNQNARTAAPQHNQSMQTAAPHLDQMTQQHNPNNQAATVQQNLPAQAPASQQSPTAQADTPKQNPEPAQRRAPEQAAQRPNPPLRASVQPLEQTNDLQSGNQQQQSVQPRTAVPQEAPVRASAGGNAGVPAPTQGEDRDLLLHRQASDNEDQSPTSFLTLPTAP